MPKLKESDFGRGAPVQWKITHKVKRAIRSNIGKAGELFNWKKGITNRPKYNIKNQLTAGSCWGQAYSRFVQIIEDGEELSAKSAYAPVSYYADGGVAIPDAKRQAFLFGLTTEKKIPSHDKDGSSTEKFMSEKTWRTKQMMAECLLRSGYEMKNVEIDIDKIAEAIRDYKAVIFVIQGQNNGTWLSARPTPPKNNNNIWAHYACSDSNIPKLNKGKKEIRFYNSWGNKIGEKGFQYLTEEYIKSGYVVDCFTFVKKNSFVR